MTVDEGIRRAFRDVSTARVATVDEGGAPHVAPLWFVWREDAIYLSARQGGATWRNAERDPRAAVVIDRGRDWIELAGVHVEGPVELLPAEHPDVRGPMSAWHEKYRSMLSGDGFERFTERVASLGFLRVEPLAIRTWDHARRS
ncbi:MAG: pyridoxamine 5'-phosphate oxidase family protein [Actinobacteria bacterium]|nr:pyridoxamine 5'-phosphate oxidase family protein [Actinomycetota bacterium]